MTDEEEARLRRGILGVIKEVSGQTNVLFAIMDQLEAAGILDRQKLVAYLQDREAEAQYSLPGAGSYIVTGILNAARAPKDRPNRWKPTVVAGLDLAEQSAAPSAGSSPDEIPEAPASPEPPSR
jgi:hypothetical protein